jgi:hypothetical protein
MHPAHGPLQDDVASVAFCSSLRSACVMWKVAVQEMPSGMHGVFPVLYGDAVHVAGGGTQAGYSQSTNHYRFTPGTAMSPQGVSAAPSAAVSMRSPQVAAVPIHSQQPTAAPVVLPAPRSFEGTPKAPLPPETVTPTAPQAASPGLQLHKLSFLPGMAFCPPVPAWATSVFVSLVAYLWC